MRSISQSFYKDPTWVNCRNAYIKQNPLCERCKQKGYIVAAEIVHHKIHLTEANMKDPAIAYNFENLESLCFECHNHEHFGDKTPRRWSFNEDGELVMSEREEE